MADKEFKRKRKAPKKQSATAALKLISSRSDAAAPVYQAAPNTGLNYAAGPLYGLAATAEALDFDALEPQHDRSDLLDSDNSAIEEGPTLRILRSPSRGQPLDTTLRRKMEQRFGRSFKDVELHSGPVAQQATRGLQAQAFTHRQHIWLGSGTKSTDARVIAHELTHVVQQGQAPPLRHRKAIGIAAPGPAPAIRPPTPAAPSPKAGAPATVQRLDIWGSVSRVGGAMVSGVRSVARGAAGVVGNVLEMGRGALLAIARRVAPDFARLFERDGIRGFVRQMLARGLRTLFSGPLGALRRMFNLGGLRERFSRVANWFITIRDQLARNDCSGITRAAQRFGDFMSRTFEPVIDRVRSISQSISEFFSGIWDAVGAPVMDLLRRIGGSVWQSIRGFIRDVGRVIRRVREALGGAWTRVKNWLGISAEDGTEEGGGLWNWIKEKASQVWDRIKGPLQPIMGSLRVVGGILVAISPAGPVIAAIHAWPYLRQAFQWVRDRWRDLNLVVRAREFMANTVLPAVREAAQRVGNALVNAADWLLGMLSRVAAGVQQVSGRLAGGLLAPLGRVISFVSGQFRRLVEWARSGLRYVATNARSLFRRLIEFIQPILAVLRRLILIAVNPFGITGLLMGTLWQVIPNCLKGPIINFIIDLLLRFLRIIPPLPQLGILWPFIRAAMLGFLDRVRSFTTERKVNVSNKIASIIAGESVSFIIGYLRGIVLGLWDGIVGPFLAIRDLFQLPEMIRNFLSSLGVRLCDLLQVIRCFISTLSDRAMGAFDSLMEAAGDLLENPGRIIDLIRCAIQAMLSAVEGVGASIATQMMALFEGPDERIGETLGRLVGSALLDAVLAFFTAGSSTALSVIRQIAGVLRTIGRNLMRVVRMVARLIPRFLGFIRKIGGMFRRAGSRAGGLLGRIGGFFRRIANWFRRLMGRIGRRFRRTRGRGRPGGRNRRNRRGRERRLWRQFKARVRAFAARHNIEGITRVQLASQLQRLRIGPYLQVVAYARVKRRSRRRQPFWVIAIKRRGVRFRLLPAKTYNVLQDEGTRWDRGRRAIRRRLRRVRGRDTNKSRLDSILLPFKRRFRFRGLEAVVDRAENDFDIMGSMSPRRKVTEVDDLTGLHDGSTTDPIPIHWYKPTTAYPRRVRIKPSPDAPSKINVPMFGSTLVRDRRNEQRRVGIDSGNLVNAGDRLFRRATRRGGEASKFSRLLGSLGYNWAGKDADHTKDLAFGGPDAPENLWPLRRGVNQRASTLGQWYGRYRIEYIERRPGQQPKGKVKTIGSLRGKWFRIIGFNYPPDPNPGGRLPRRNT